MNYVYLVPAEWEVEGKASSLAGTHGREGAFGVRDGPV